MKKGVIFKSLILLFFFINDTDLLSEQLKIKVFNINGSPLENAEVKIKGEVFRTDSKGECVIEIKDYREVKVKISHSYYYEKELVFVMDKRDREVEVVLVPYVGQKEEIMVTATRYPELSLKIPVSEKVLTKESIEEKMFPTIEQFLNIISGISSIGSGGYSKVPAVRGIARKRTLILVENSRVFSDRRTGPNASFVDPEEIERIEIIKSPYSVQYGSEAMGGVIHVFTKDFPEKEFEGKLNLKYGFNGEEKKGGLQIGKSFGNYGFLLSVNALDSENYSSSAEVIPMSYYSRYNIFLRLGHKNEKRKFSAGFLLSRGIDIGKPAIDSGVYPTYYPRENHNLFFLNLRKKLYEKGEVFVHFSINPNFLETLTEKLESYKVGESFARTESVDKNFQLSYKGNLFKNMKFIVGIDSFLRSSCNAKNIYRNFSEKGSLIGVSEDQPIKNGSFFNAGLFLTIDYPGFERFDFIAGVRGDIFQLKSEVSDSSTKNNVSDKSLTGFAGISFEFKDNYYLFTNFSTAYRVPDLSERFYTGITGRGFIYGTPDLKPERSYNFETGVKIAQEYLFAGVYLFNYSMKNLIERYRKEGRIYSYANLEKGYLRGIEGEIEYLPFHGLKFYANFHWFKGESELKKVPLNDVPPPRIIFGSRVYKGKFWGDISCYAQRKHEKPGSSEVTISGFAIFNFSGGYYAGGTRIYLNVNNIFNKYYIPRPDPDAREERGRSISLSLSYGF
ncbi:MAG: TonB-dependent receptor [Candidatus Aminicenantia bacterium]